MPCPTCHKPAQAEYAPFCSKRCQEIDLHRWMSGQYAIPAAELDDPEEDTLPTTLQDSLASE